MKPDDVLFMVGVVTGLLAAATIYLVVSFVREARALHAPSPTPSPTDTICELLGEPDAWSWDTGSLVHVSGVTLYFSNCSNVVTLTGPAFGSVFSRRERWRLRQAALAMVAAKMKLEQQRRLNPERLEREAMVDRGIAVAIDRINAEGVIS